MKYIIRFSDGQYLQHVFCTGMWQKTTERDLALQFTDFYQAIEFFNKSPFNIGKPQYNIEVYQQRYADVGLAYQAAIMDYFEKLNSRIDVGSIVMHDRVRKVVFYKDEIDSVYVAWVEGDFPKIGRVSISSLKKVD